VHWPETMLTYLREDKILFTCDFLGSHLATSGLYASDRGRVAEAAKRYYGEIMMPFARNIAKHLDRLAAYDIRLIAPSHGPMHDDPSFIIDLYRDWAVAEPKNQVLVAFVSMHGSTQQLTEHLVTALIGRGIAVERFDLTVTDLGKLAMGLVDSATVLVGSPTMLAGPHPQAIYATNVVNALRPKTKFIGVYGSYGWGTRVDQQIAAICANLRVELLPPVLVKGAPRPEDFAAIEKLADAVLEKHKEAGIA